MATFDYMKEISIEELAYQLNYAKQNNHPQPIFFLGAGASKSGNIPLAADISKDILSDYSDIPCIQKLDPGKRTYSKLMGCLTPHQRNELLKKIIKEAKVNVTHIYLAQLLKNGYVDYVLTVNFDNLMLRALSLFNVFPPTYDMAILKDLTTTTLPERSVVYLHGQHHGLWLLNTDEEMKRVEKTVPSIFDSIKNRRPWIFIGYSGSDPIFDHVKGLGRFDNGLYWIGYGDDMPGKNVQEFLETPNTNSFYINGYDADAFMLKLNEKLGLEQPEILDKPFSSLRTMLEEINDINDEEHFNGVKERLEMAKKNVGKSIRQFEEQEIVSVDEKELNIDKLKMEIIGLLIAGIYSKQQVTAIEQQAKQINDPGTNNLLSGLYYNWGNYLGELAKTKAGKEAEDLYVQAFEKFHAATRINPDKHEAFYNWGNYLGELAKTKTDQEAEDLYEQAFEKYHKATEIKPDKHEAFNNWGTGLGTLAKLKTGQEAENLYVQAFDKFHKATEIKADLHEVFHNWGTYLGNLAKTKAGQEAEGLYVQAFEKYRKATGIKTDLHEAFNNWGNYLGDLARTKMGQEAKDLYFQAFEKYRKATEIKPDKHEAFYNWGTYLVELANTKVGQEAEDLYRQAFEKFRNAIEIKQDKYEVFHNWGMGLGNFAKTKIGQEAEDLYIHAFEKYRKATKIKPDLHETFYSWGTDLGELAKTKAGQEAEDLYKQAFEKLRKATEIKPNNYKALYNWGSYLGDLAKVKEGKAAEDLYEQAFEKYHKSIEYGSRHYNLACLYAIRGNRKEALHFLDISLGNKEVSIDVVLRDDDWQGFLDDESFKSIIEKYKEHV